MGSIVGFSICRNLGPDPVEKLTASQKKVLGIFPHLEFRDKTIGTSRLFIWGHDELDERLHIMPDGSILLVIGSPHGEINWLDVQKKLLSNKFILPWEGRVILFRISADGKRWTMWNDWLGSIPVFYATIGQGIIASTLEPVVVAAAEYTSEHFFMPGLVSLLINGHFISDWTLYKGMKVVMPDSVSEWDDLKFRTKRLWTVEPSQSRWETGWDDLIDEMHELSYKAVSNALKSHPNWTLPLSSGLDSRLIAGIAADIGAKAHTYTWGGANTTDVIYSRQIAKALGFPWKHIVLPVDFLVKHTPNWANWFGSGMHFHGMYQLAFYNEIRSERSGPVLSGFVGDVLAGDAAIDLLGAHSEKSYQMGSEWYCAWSVDLLKRTAKFPVDEALEANAHEIGEQIRAMPGVKYQKLHYLELWNRQRFLTCFQSAVADYWRGVSTPFMDREYARFCLSLPLLALENRNLLSRVFRRYYGRLAVIPGSYGREPFILTGKYLFLRRIAESLLPVFHRGPLKGFRDVQLRMDIESVQSTGRDALWPLLDVRHQLGDWLDMTQIEQDYRTITSSKDDILPLRRLQTAQTLAYRLIKDKVFSPLIFILAAPLLSIFEMLV